MGPFTLTQGDKKLLGSVAGALCKWYGLSCSVWQRKCPGGLVQKQQMLGISQGLAEFELKNCHVIK